MCLNPLPRTVKDSAEAGVWSSHCPVSGLDVVSEFRFLCFCLQSYSQIPDQLLVCVGGAFAEHTQIPREGRGGVAP